MRFHTFKSDPLLVTDEWGWSDVGDYEVTRLGLVDPSGLFARCDYADSLRVAERFDAELLTPALVNEIWRVGKRTEPVIVRETDEERREREARGGQDPLERMATREWAERHDQGLWRQLEDWDHVQPVAGAKDWVAGAAPGRALNYGFIRANGTPIQTLGTRHDAGHVDYSQWLRLCRRIARKAA